MNDLLDLAKAESGRLEPDLGDVDLGNVFAELRGALRPLVASDVVFDIEAVFIYPWAIQFRSLGWFGLVEMFSFLAVVIVARVARRCDARRS